MNRHMQCLFQCSNVEDETNRYEGFMKYLYLRYILSCDIISQYFNVNFGGFHLLMALKTT